MVSLLTRRTRFVFVFLFDWPVMQWISLLVSMLVPAKALDNGLALTPPMGWLSWLRFGCGTDCRNYPNTCLSEALIKRTADRMASDGYKKAGYEYIIIDDCWLERNRDKDGRLVADKKRFKSGIKAVADYVHSKGLKFGIYEDIGSLTCAGYPGSKGHEKIDAETFASWGVDYIKIDACNERKALMNADFLTIGKALNETGREILYSCCWANHVDNPNYTMIGEHCNTWRNHYDIHESWGSISEAMDWFGDRPELTESAGPGHFHDPDMLVVGHDQITVDQAKVQMAVWAILAAPLLMSTDLDTIKPELKELLLNKHIIAVSQDPLGQMGRRIHKNNDLQVWERNVTGGLVVAFVNTNNTIQTHNFTKIDLNLSPTEDLFAFNLFAPHTQSKWIGNTTFSIKINATGVRLFKFSKYAYQTNEATLSHCYWKFRDSSDYYDDYHYYNYY